MLRLGWMTDIHLNFVTAEQLVTLLETTAERNLDALLITGDIGEAHTVCDLLIRFVEKLDIPIYFVLGNHDYYFGNISSVRAAVTRLCDEYEKLHWLPLCNVIELSPKTALVGHGCWADGGYGNFLDSSVTLNDYILIGELAAHSLNRPPLLEAIRTLGKEAGDYLRRALPGALQEYKQVTVALHVPPFQETAWHEGKTPADDDPFLPHFSCKAVGDVLLEMAGQYPGSQINVLCGHTHGSGDVQIRPNLRVVTGGAEYGEPKIQQVFTL